MAPAEVPEEQEKKLERLSGKSDGSRSSSGLKWPSDPSRCDDLAIEEQLKFYKQRDLRVGKIQKIANEVWKAPIRRKRVHFAPPMFHNEPRVPKITNTTNVNQDEVSTVPQESRSEAEVAAKKYQTEFDDYKEWIAQRKKFRNDLDNMGASEDWLSRKPDRTPLEERLLRKMIAARTPVVVPPPRVEVPNLDPIPTKYLPIVQRPSPTAIDIIEKFLHQKKMRLIDLFASVDKTKCWMISRAAFRTAVQEAGIPISDIMLEDLILALDVDLNDELDYRELARGMSLWKQEKRDRKSSPVNPHRSASSAALSHHLGLEPPTIIEEDRSSQLRKDKEGIDDGASRDSRSKSSCSTASTLLTPPPLDTHPDARPFSSAEARIDHRKIERHILKKCQGGSLQAPSPKGKVYTKGTHLSSKRNPIKTGNTAVDRHSQPSTLSDENGDLIDKYRQLKLKEYYDIINLCKENDVKLTEKLFERVLLHPPDEPHTLLKKKVRQPGQLIDTEGLTDMRKPTVSDLKPKKSAKAKENQTPDRLLLSRDDSVLLPGKENEVSQNTYVNGAHDASNDPWNDGHQEVGGGRFDLNAALAREKKIKRMYPPIADVAPSNTKMHLSTGKAFVHRQVDCWMSFEEYDNLTRHLAHKHHEMEPTDDNAFWPGQLLGKMRLYFPSKQDKKGSMFNIIKREKPIYPLLGHKPVLAYK